MELLLNRRNILGVTLYFVRWRGHWLKLADDEWLEELRHCPQKVARYEASPSARPGRATAPPLPPASAPVAAAPSQLLAPACFPLALGADS